MPGLSWTALYNKSGRLLYLPLFLLGSVPIRGTGLFYRIGDSPQNRPSK